ncbi:hypothetical protein, partial [uncultured Paraglaciecola sp.]|uniref:hypothetical protein n=1 Tax=uncultured Paraglaciecola sp. TaxID=1765024 RepID=UPI0030D83483
MKLLLTTTSIISFSITCLVGYSSITNNMLENSLHTELAVGSKQVPPTLLAVGSKQVPPSLLAVGSKQVPPTLLAVGSKQVPPALLAVGSK